MTVAELPAADEDWEPEDTFGARLALIRQRFHWNVTEAALATGIAPATWTKWEEGSMPRDYMKVCSQIAGSTKCSEKWLVGGSRNWKLMMAPDLHVLAGSATASQPLDRSGPRHLSLV